MDNLNQIQSLLANLSNDIQTMHDNTSRQMDTFMGALDDIAAHTLAVQAILVTLLETHPVDMDKVLGWIDANTQGTVENGGDVSKSKALATYLVTGKAE